MLKNREPVKLLTIKETSEMTGLSVQIVQRLIREGQLPVVDLSALGAAQRTLRIRQDDLATLVESHPLAPPQPVPTKQPATKTTKIKLKRVVTDSGAVYFFDGDYYHSADGKWRFPRDEFEHPRKRNTKRNAP